MKRVLLENSMAMVAGMVTAQLNKSVMAKAAMNTVATDRLLLCATVSNTTTFRSVPDGS